MRQSLTGFSQQTDSTETLRRHGRSFYWAGQLLSGEQLSRAASLYSLCRDIDDLADDALSDAQKSVARRKLGNLDRAFAETVSPDKDLEAVYEQAQQLFYRQPLALGALRDMLATMQQDLKPVRMADQQDLLQYAYGVAGTVGVMMTSVLGARDQSRALPHAIDLGIGMQLTNMARDVLEDAHLGRVYLPADSRAGALEPQALIIGDVESRHRAWKAVSDLIMQAEAYYISGWQGLGYLPLRPRLAIAVAACVYREIGRQILRRGEARYWQTRSVVGPGRKLVVSLRALAHLAAESGGKQLMGHDSNLHKGLNTCLSDNAQEPQTGGHNASPAGQ